jgi:hypothetical protein
MYVDIAVVIMDGVFVHLLLCLNVANIIHSVT